MQAFEVFEGIPRRTTNDNMGIAVSKIMGCGRERRLTWGFLQLQSHDMFQHHFCRPARGNEKGVVEGWVKFTRLNFFVPVPQVRDMEKWNGRLRQHCTEDRERRLRGNPRSKAVLLLEDQATFLPLPASAFVAQR